MSEVPPGWAWTALGQIGEYLNGRGFKKSEWRETGRPIIRIQNLTGTSSTFNYFDGESDERYTVRAGDLLVSWAATLGVFVWKGPEAVVNQHIFKVRSQIDRGFHRYLLLATLDALRRQSHGSGMVHITKSRFDETPVALPPLNEQRRIVAAIEEHFSRLDAAESSLRRATARLAGLRSSSYRETLAGDWPIEPLSRIADVRLGRQRSPKNHVGDNMRPYLRAANVTWEGLDLSDVKQMNFTPDEVTTYRLRPGDVLVAEASGSASEVGKTTLWAGTIEDCCFQNTLLRVRTRGPLPEFLAVVLQQFAIWGDFGRAAPGVGIHHLGAARLSAWPTPVPPVEEQHRIVAEIEQRLSQLDSIESAISAANRRSAALRRSILERAFRGELVPQDPSDEPASALLERIVAERATAEEATGRRPRRRATMERS